MSDIQTLPDHMKTATQRYVDRHGEPRFFARARFPMAPNQKPKWHRIERVTSEKMKLDGIRYVALCGYSHTFDIFEEPALRKDVKTRTLRCKDCDRKYEKEQNQ